MKRFFAQGLIIGTMIIIGIITPILPATQNFLMRVATVEAQVPGTQNTPFEGGGGGPTTPSSSGQPSSVPPNNEDTAGTSKTGYQCDGAFSFMCNLTLFTSKILSGPPMFLAGLAGMIFDYSLWFSIQSSTYSKYAGLGSDNEAGDTVVEKGWKLVRDFANLVFIFVLFFVAFILILGLDDGQNPPLGINPKKTIVRVIIVALLVNFSFFLGRVVIDFGNVLALTFYSQITLAPDMKPSSGFTDPGDSTGSSTQSFYTNLTGIKSVSTGILSRINPQTFLLGDDESGILEPEDYGIVIFYSLIVAIISLFLVYIFLSTAILFFARTLGLFLLLIMSPIAFVSFTIPKFQSMKFAGGDDWMEQFFGLVFSAPIFLFFLYIAIQFFEPVATGSSSNSFALAANVLIRIALFIFFFVFAKKITTDLSGKIGSMASGAITSVTAGIVTAGAAVATGGAALGAMRTAGALGAGGGSTGAGGTNAPQTGSSPDSSQVQSAQQRLRNSNFKGLPQMFKDIPQKIRGGVSQGMNNLKTNPLGTIGGIAKSGAIGYGKLVGTTTMGIAKKMGSSFPDKIDPAITRGKKAGEYLMTGQVSQKTQQEDIDQKKKTKDQEIKNLEQKLKQESDPLKKQEIRNQINDAKKQRGALEQTPVQVQTPNQGQPNGASGTGQSSTPQTNQPELPQKNSGSPAGNPNDLRVENLRVNNLVIGNDDATKGKSVENSSQPVPQYTNSQGRSFGDEKGPGPQYTEKQQDRILRKAIEAEDRKNGIVSQPKQRAQVLLGNIQSGAVNFRDTPPKTYTNNQGRFFGDGKDAKPQYTPNTQEKILNRAIAAQAKKEQNELKKQTFIAEKNTEGQQRNTIDQSGLVETPDTMDFGGIQIPGQNDDE